MKYMGSIWEEVRQQRHFSPKERWHIAYSDPKIKETLLNEQFSSVFTKEDKATAFGLSELKRVEWGIGGLDLTKNYLKLEKKTKRKKK